MFTNDAPFAASKLSSMPPNKKLKTIDKKEDEMRAIIDTKFPPWDNELSQINPLYYSFKTLESVPIVLMHQDKYTEPIIISPVAWATACLTFNINECTEILCKAVLTSDDCNQPGGIPVLKKYSILNAVGWIMNKKNDFWLSPANIPDNEIWLTEEARDLKEIVSILIENFKPRDDETNQEDELQETSENIPDTILSKFTQIYKKAVETESFSNSYEIMEYLIRAFHKDRIWFLGGVSINAKAYSDAYLLESGIDAMTKIIITSLEKDLGQKIEICTSPILKLITYQCVAHMRDKRAKMFVTSAKSGERSFLSEEEINQLEDNIFTMRNDDVRIPIESTSQKDIQYILYNIVESNILNDTFGDFQSSSPVSQCELPTSSAIISFESILPNSDEPGVVFDLDTYQLELSGGMEPSLPAWTEDDYMNSQERPEMLLKPEEVPTLVSVFTNDRLNGCKSLLNKIFKTTEQQGMNWSGRSINGCRHAAFIRNSKTFFIFYFLRLVNTMIKLKADWKTVHEDKSIELVALTRLEFNDVKQHIFIEKAAKTISTR